ncbi:hypothetical protein [Streptomyces candidus]|uniref:Uncharacterized protein n=1 Tax=Streptomyces candidus TaxID=67283 RepID=A0A7X0LNH6_9ACTN|nr:hypothetical protein [Streptomyces candidus]MBB6434940.1 hypothetical protein [Streptomyces candidus]GHH41305.1 hypothetical protein GCM10018773_24300 [Streptomyces candidus]
MYTDDDDHQAPDSPAAPAAGSAEASPRGQAPATSGTGTGTGTGTGKADPGAAHAPSNGDPAPNGPTRNSPARNAPPPAGPTPGWPQLRLSAPLAPVAPGAAPIRSRSPSSSPRSPRTEEEAPGTQAARGPRGPRLAAPRPLPPRAPRPGLPVRRSPDPATTTLRTGGRPQDPPTTTLRTPPAQLPGLPQPGRGHGSHGPRPPTGAHTGDPQHQPPHPAPRYHQHRQYPDELPAPGPSHAATPADAHAALRRRATGPTTGLLHSVGFTLLAVVEYFRSLVNNLSPVQRAAGGSAELRDIAALQGDLLHQDWYQAVGDLARIATFDQPRAALWAAVFLALVVRLNRSGPARLQIVLSVLAAGYCGLLALVWFPFLYGLGGASVAALAATGALLWAATRR